MTKRPQKRGRPRLYDMNAERQRAYRKRRREALQAVAVPPSHTNDRWKTPQKLFDKLDAEFHFTTDVAALPENAKCAHYYTPEQDGLHQLWTGVCWCNPPYGRGKIIEQWVRKAYESAKAGATVVCLLPSSTDTYWFQHLALPYAEIRFLEGRQNFSGKGRARFANVIVIYRPPRVAD